MTCKIEKKEVKVDENSLYPSVAFKMRRRVGTGRPALFVMEQPCAVKRLRDGDEVFKTKAIVEHLKKGDLIPFDRPIETKRI